MVKKLLLTCVLLSSVISVEAATCSSITQVLVLKSESPQVKMMQSLLVSKGYLKVAPNGYFGPATAAALKAYQKVKGIPVTGTTASATRDILNKDLCGTVPSVSATSTSTKTVARSSVSLIPPPLTPLQLQTPAITSIDKFTLFVGGTTTWPIALQGKNFDTVNGSNKVYFTQTATGKRYLVTTASSTNGTTITLPTNIGQKVFSCGANCNEVLQAGDYMISIVTSGGESNTVFTSVKAMNLSVTTGSLYAPLQNKTTNARIAILNLGSSAGFQIISITPVTTGEGVSNGAAGGLILKDELTGVIFQPNTEKSQVSPNQSKIIGLYGNINTPVSGRLNTVFQVVIQDFLGNKQTSFVSPSVITTIS